ncbi:TlpA disulfide reductase family protein [Pseudalkalibacillus caeni]|uniref:TlpA family protein disulfide reductase n=1 Tax=Exobacillus caeni TaxID=2574798 RepID=A0A5R9F947_9BACL|nr:TlpA disulfide reductase family protein [Pseudalkalibacillus caeni]TLS38790.1 TlpA family protein disulfide reductase [Pseudalkalibacillus caeni]
MKAPDFTLEDYRSKKMVSLEDYKGRVVMITFWVSWCPDCMQDLPLKEQFYRSMDSEDLAFLSINVTGREKDENAGPEFIEKHQLPFPILLDKGRQTYDAYDCRTVPTTVILNKKHEIAAKFEDKATFIDIMKELSNLL